MAPLPLKLLCLYEFGPRRFTYKFILSLHIVVSKIEVKITLNLLIRTTILLVFNSKQLCCSRNIEFLECILDSIPIAYIQQASFQKTPI